MATAPKVSKMELQLTWATPPQGFTRTPAKISPQPKLYDALNEEDVEDEQLYSYTIEDAPTKLMALEILAQAAADTELAEENGYVAACARAYLTNKTRWLATVCDWADVDMDYLVRTWRKKLGGVQPFPQDYWRSATTLRKVRTRQEMRKLREREGSNENRI